MKGSYDRRITAAAEAVANSRFLLIGGGAGLSEAAGLSYGGERFSRLFGDYAARYGITDMYGAVFYPFGTEGETWAHLCRHVLANRYDPPALDLYRGLVRLAGRRDSFVVTTNVDAQFYKAGFDPGRVFAVQGDYGKFQCGRACHDTLYDNEAQIRAMRAAWRDFSVPGELLPRCPVCGGPASLNIRADGYFVEDEAWRAAEEAYETFLSRAAGAVTLLEIGVGYNTPGIIRFPFDALAASGAAAALLRVNRDHPEAGRGAEGRTISFTEDPARVISDLLNLVD